jgi:ketosteroid isomerase-like protein
MIATRHRVTRRSCRLLNNAWSRSAASLIVVALILGGAMRAPAAAPQAQTLVQNGISEPVRAWVKAVEAGDASAIAAMNTPDTVVYGVDTMRLIGARDVAAVYAAMFADNKVSVAILEPHYVVSGDFVHSWGLFELRLVPRKIGAPSLVKGRFSDLAIRRNGQWQDLMDHASLPYTAPAKAGTPKP